MQGITRDKVQIETPFLSRLQHLFVENGKYAEGMCKQSHFKRRNRRRTVTEISYHNKLVSLATRFSSHAKWDSPLSQEGRAVLTATHTWQHALLFQRWYHFRGAHADRAWGPSQQRDVKNLTLHYWLLRNSEYFYLKKPKRIFSDLLYIRLSPDEWTPWFIHHRLQVCFCHCWIWETWIKL